MPFTVARLGSSSSPSLSRIFAKATLLEGFALYPSPGPRVTAKDSTSSGTASSAMGMEMVASVAPGAKVNTPRPSV